MVRSCISLCFDLHFPNENSEYLSCVYWTFVYILWERFIQIFCPFLNWVVCLLLLVCRSSRSILDTYLLLEVCSTNLTLRFAFLIPLTVSFWRRKWQPSPVLLPGESQGRGSLVGCRLWGHTELDTTEAA